MKFEKIMRTSMVVMGLGVAMLLAKPAAAQEEVARTQFEEVGMARIDQPVNAAPTTQLATFTNQAPQHTAPTEVAAKADAADAMAPVEGRGVHKGDTPAMAILMMGTGSILLTGLVSVAGGRRRKDEE